GPKPIGSHRLEQSRPRYILQQGADHRYGPKDPQLAEDADPSVRKDSCLHDLIQKHAEQTQGHCARDSFGALVPVPQHQGEINTENWWQPRDTHNASVQVEPWT